MKLLTVRPIQIVLLFLIASLSPLFGDITVAAFYGADPVIIVKEDGTATGFFPEMLRKLLPDESITFITDISFQEAYRKVRDNEIDLLPAAVRTVERERELVFNEEVFLVSWGELFVDHDTVLDNIFDVQFKRVGLMMGDQNAKNFITMMDNFDIHYTPVYYDDLSTMAEAVKQKDVDAMVAYSSFNAQGLLKSMGVVFSPTQAFVAAGKEIDSGILEKIDSRLAEMKEDNDSIYYELLEEWFHYDELIKRPPWLYPVLISLAMVLFVSFLFILVLQLRIVKSKNDMLIKEKEFDEAVEQADLNYRIIAEHNYDWEFWITPEIKFIYCSPSCYDFTGYKPEDFYKNPRLVEDLIIPEDRQKWRDHYNNINSGEQIEQLRIKTRSGDLRWLRYRCRHIYNDQGRFLGHRGSFLDLSDQVKAEKSLTESERKYRILIENSGDVIWSMDKSLCITYLNDKLRTLIGRPEHEILGRPCGSVFSKADVIQSTRIFEECLRTGNTQYLNLNIENRMNGEAHILSVVSAYHDDSESCIICYGRDITEKNRLELQIQRSQRLESLGILAGSFAHDLNNLLTPISGYAQFIKMDNEEGDDNSANADMILSVTKKAGDLIRKLLLFSKKEKINYEEIQINTLLNAFQILAKTFLRKSIVLKYDLSDEDLIVYGDSVQIEQVLVNLILNAQDAMDNGGSITISSARLTDPIIPDGNGTFTLPSSDFCRITVEDSGSGMDEATLSRVFEPFFTTKNEKGNGLGLSSSYGIIKQMKGFIFADSQVSVGTSFRIYFPLSMH